MKSQVIVTIMAAASMMSAQNNPNQITLGKGWKNKIIHGDYEGTFNIGSNADKRSNK